MFRWLFASVVAVGLFGGMAANALAADSAPETKPAAAVVEEHATPVIVTNFVMTGPIAVISIIALVLMVLILFQLYALRGTIEKSTIGHGPGN